MKLWSKETTNTSQLVETFTVGRDKEFDILLAKYDVQGAVDIKLYLRAEVLAIKEEVKQTFDLLIAQSEKFKDHLLPGYTHLQIAMPSSFGLWFGAYAESFVDDLEMVLACYNVANKNPLG